MSRLLHRYELCLYNFSSIFCLKSDDQVFKVSNFAAFVNILKIPFVIFFAFIMSLNHTLRDTITQESLVVLKNYSSFAKLSIIIGYVLLFVTSFVFCLWHAIKRHDVRDFIEIFLKNSLDDKYFIKYKSYCLRHSVALFILVLIVLLISFIGSFKMSILSVIALLVFSYPFVMFVSFASFVTTFENYIIVSLKRFKSELKKHNHAYPSYGSSERLEKYLKLSKTYQEIYELFMKFHHCFGPQITFVNTNLIAILIFCVRIIYLVKSLTSCIY